MSGSAAEPEDAGLGCVSGRGALQRGGLGEAELRPQRVYCGGPERGKAPVPALELTLWGFSSPRPRLHDDSPLARLPGTGNERDPTRGVGVRGTPESSISLPERG